MSIGRQRLIWLGVVIVLLALLAITRPWVVRPLDASGAAQVGPPKFVAATYVDSIWADKIVGAGVAGAKPVAEASASAAFLKGEGKVLSIDRSSQVGLALVDLAPGDGKADVKLQIGPVTRGSDLRDAAGLRFSDFDTQIDFANVADALSAKAIKVLPPMDALVGKTIKFVAAGTSIGSGAPELLPVSIEAAP